MGLVPPFLLDDLGFLISLHHELTLKGIELLLADSHPVDESLVPMLHEPHSFSQLIIFKCHSNDFLFALHL